VKNPFLTVRGYLMEVVDELKRCSWPTGQELRDHTIIVIVAVAILGLAVAVVDFTGTWCIRHLTRL
jgi:preprotein translocase subunit SecE